MQWNWRRRLSRRDAERVLAGDPVGPEHPELSRLLAAASAPPHPDELVGQQEVMAAFERAVRTADRAAARPRRRWWSALRREWGPPWQLRRVPGRLPHGSGVPRPCGWPPGRQ
ncbi:hypothetical protein [Phytohabitans rumicis]|uniref:Uncharacterized protein n=1 Tax=Phytohabitans rumicis TaxID=1076125 RepID=A0A6V8L6A3_9ACTN|nr:hypothetical protein [Phytohabitans rumicis]GFJ90169.1 hypothetical protein Prum_038110 [Phytohabitans rumicis]